jgi:hypothetical protein
MRTPEHKSIRIYLVMLMTGILISCGSATNTTSQNGVASATSRPETPADTAVATQPPGSEQGPSQRCLSGYVVGGGDMTPEGLIDSPRTFVFKVRTDDRSELNVSYTAYPPSPARPERAFRLALHAGAILIGDYLKSCGRYEAANNTIVVAGQGDYIETFAQKP